MPKVTAEKQVPELLFTLAEVGQILKCNRNAVSDLVRHGHIKAMKLGHLKVSVWEVERFIRDNEGKDFSDLRNVVDL